MEKLTSVKSFLKMLFGSYQDRAQKNSEITVLKPWDTLKYGILFNAILLAVVWVVITGICAILSGVFDGWFLRYLLYVAAGCVSVGWGFFQGTHNVPMGHQAVPKLFDEPLEHFVLSHGWHWLPPPPFMDITIQDVRPRVTQTKQTDITSDGIEVEGSANIEWRYANARQSLLIEKSVIDEGFVGLMQEIIQVAIRELTSENVLNAFRRNKAHSKARNALTIRAQEKAAHWGIEIIDTTVSNIDFVSKEFKDKLRKGAEEKIERNYEQNEIDGFVDKAERLKHAFPTLTHKEALDNAKVITAKTQETISEQRINILGLDKAAAAIAKVIADALGKKENDE